jgi:micrococcal nuclease
MWGKYRRWPRFKPLALIATIVVLGGWLYLRAASDGSVGGSGLRLGAFSEPIAAARSGECEVLAVIDGDTLLVRQAARTDEESDFIGKVRLLGINTPETVKRDAAPQPWGQEATQFLRDKTKAGNVRLELDKRRIDRYGRCLAYVYVGNQHLNEELVAAGLARVHTYPGDSMTINRQLLKAQDAARNRELGIWSKK